MNPWSQFAPELVTDLYELTMAASYLNEGMSGEATFSLFIRKYPPGRSYFVAAGLEHFIDLVTRFRFQEDSLRFLASTGKFSPVFLDHLRNLRFTGSIRALPEGRLFFADEPLLEVTAPIIESQVIETLVINVLQLETLIASKAARCVHAAQGLGLIDFSLRRTHGVDAGLKAARASYLAGFTGTSNVLAGKIYGIPIFGTMAHSYITSFEHEMDAFRAFARAFPDSTVLLIDTYDTLNGARKAVRLARELDAQGKTLRGVRLDSGDLATLSREVRQILDEAGLGQVRILASGSLDEFRIRDLREAGSAIDAFAVGTHMGVSADAPYFDIAYKLVEYETRPVLKLSSGKRTWVGRKQIYRAYDASGMMMEDWLCLADEEGPGCEGLLEEVVARGERVRPEDSLESIRARLEDDFRRLPEECKDLGNPRFHPVRVSRLLQDLEEETSLKVKREEVGETGSNLPPM
ncbi:MAG: nicotinate phosphoribosyltransferase [Syntrophobacteraceae bacterium]|jgi:nicotinate phosphoribosyltransferase|nr:nicotinate phosphoribosyltransferase [Syntrophobacteraceae bacterium]